MILDPHILVAEDDDDDFFLLARELRKAGHTRVARVTNGRDVLEYLEGVGAYRDRSRHPFPDLVFLDLKMPELRGEDVLRAIRENPKLTGLPVYIQTGSDETRDRQIVASLGASGYFVKPLLAADITAALKT